MNAHAWRPATALATIAGASLLLVLARSAGGGPGEILVCLRDSTSTNDTAPSGRAAADPADLQRLLAGDLTSGPARAALLQAQVSTILPAGSLPASPRARTARARLARTLAIRLAPGQDAAALAAALGRLDAVEWVSPNRTIPILSQSELSPAPASTAPASTAPASTPPAASAPDTSSPSIGGGDPRRPEQWYLDRVGAEGAWAVTAGRPDVLIAIIDTGVLRHEDLTGNLWVNDDPPGNGSFDDDSVDQDGSGTVEDWERADDDDNGYVDDSGGYDFVDAPRIGGPGDAVERDNDVTDDSGHGTAMTGVAGAVAGNGVGIAGLAPGCTVMPVRAGFNSGFGPFSGVLEEDDAAAAIVYAAENGARVISMSWGDTLLSPVIGDGIAYARELGVLLVASAGNSRFDGAHYPSGLDGVIAAGASDRDDARSSFSNFGPTLDLLAPGSGILTTAGVSDYVPLSGTSLSAPLVAATAALLVSRDPALDPLAIAAILHGSTADLFAPGWDRESGHGRLDARRALAVTRHASLAIHHPAAGAGVNDETPVIVTAEGLRLDEYSLEVGAGRDPQSFTLIAGAAGRQVVEDTVAIWQAADLPGGEYTLRLRARDQVEGQLEERTLIVVDHTAPVVSGASAAPLWVEDRLTPFVFFSTDDLARGAIEITGGPGGGRRIDEAFFTRDHVLRVPEDLPGGLVELAIEATNAAGLAGAGPLLPVTHSGARAHTHALAPSAPRLPAGELAPRPADLDGDGDQDLVFMADVPGSPFGPLVIHSAIGDDAYAASDTLPFELLPRDIADTDGDGRMEILASGFATACLLESPGPLAYPTAKVWADTGGFAIGFAELAAGPAILAIKSDSLLIFRSTGDASTWSRSAVANFTSGTRSLAPTFFAGDIDADGAVEVVIGDASGDLLAYRDTGAGALVPAYSLRLPVGSTPLVTGGDLDGDGRPEIVVDQLADLDLVSEALLERRRHRVFVVSATATAFAEPREVLGVAGAEPRQNVVRAASIDSDPEDEILLVAAPDFYVIDSTGADLFPSFYQGGVRTGSLAVGDGDGDGRIEVFARAGVEVVTFEGRDPALPGPLPPDGLRARLLAGGDVDLAWNPGASRYRVYRAAGPQVDCVPAQLLTEVTAPAYRDTTADQLAELTYRVSAVEASIEGQCSRPLTLVRGEAPVVLAVVAEQARVVRVGFSTPMDASADHLESYRLLDPGGGALPLSSVLAVGEGRARLLVLGGSGLTGPGLHRVILGELRSVSGVPLADPREIEFAVPEDLPALGPLYLESAAGAAGGEARLRLSVPPDSARGADPASYTIAGGFRIAGAIVAGRDVRLLLDPTTPLRPGIHRVALAPVLRGAAGEVVVPGRGDEAELTIGGELVAYPNPYDAGRALSDGVNIVGLAPGERVILLDALGREVLRVDARIGGSAYIPVRDNPKLASGIYLYRVEGGGGDRLGKLAILR